MTHDLRIVEIGALPRALEGIARADGTLVRAARDLAGGSRRALIVGSLADGELDALRSLAERIGVAALGGWDGASRRSPLVLLTGDEGFAYLASLMEVRGLAALGAAVREALENYRQDGFVLEFADGGTLELGRTARIMGVLNVTPDSFSDGGRFEGLEGALEAAARMAEEGADLLDIGGESTRPGAPTVDAEEELRRVVPVVEAVRRSLPVRVSVDTRKPGVALRAIEAGADMVNDVSAFADPEMLKVVRESRAPAVAMHMRGDPPTMQSDTRYEDLMGEILVFLRGALERAAEAGVPKERILVDPGIGFGKSPGGNLEILRQLPALRVLGRPVLVGASRKSFIGAVLDLPVADRLEGSLAAAAVALWQGAHVVRVHDVAATRRVARMIDAIRAA